LLILPFLGSVLAAFLPTDARNREAWMAFGLALAGLVGTAAMYPAMVREGVLHFRLEWLPAAGLEFVLRLDALAWLFCILVFGIGLLVGTWFGRARWLIPLGLVLVLLLGSGYAAFGHDHWRRDGFGAVALRPQSVAEIRDSYRRNVGVIELDLSDVDFAGARKDVILRVNLGAIEVRVPSDVDVTVDASIDIGSATVFGDSWDGFGAGAREIFDAGPDGVGGGELHITATVNTGSLEIHRDR